VSRGTVAFGRPRQAASPIREQRVILQRHDATAYEHEDYILGVLSPASVNETINRIVMSHEAAAAWFAQTFILDGMQDDLRSFWQLRGLDRTSTDPRLDIPFDMAFQKAIVSIITAWLLRWKMRFHFYTTVGSVPNTENPSFVQLAFQEIVEHLQRKPVDRNRQRFWFMQARDMFFSQNPDEQSAAEQSGWYAWAFSEESTNEYLMTEYLRKQPFEWMFGQLQSATEQLWPMREGRGAA
jgi:hypothetical protein